MPCAFHLDRPALFSDLGSGCQFPNNGLTELDGKWWCRCHLPLKSQKGVPSPKANWGYKEIKPCLQWLLESARERKEVVDLCGVIFPGDFDLKSVCSPSDLPHGIIFHKAIFNGTADFREFEFKDANNFGKVRFNSDALFNTAIFRCIADFQDAEFAGGADFGKTQFHQHANFSSARFIGNALFTEVTFANGMDFEESIFNHEANFQSMKSVEGSIFRSTRFGGLALFQGAHFAGPRQVGDVSDSPSIDFSNVQFATDAGFHGTTFGNVTKFDGAKFGGSTDFSHARFEKGVLFSRDVEFVSDSNFSDAKFFGIAEFKKVRFRDSADFEKALFDHESRFQSAQFDGSGNFKDASFRDQSRFQGVRFGDNVNFIDTKFDGDIEFDGAQFCGDADIHGSESEGIHAASFARVRFEKSARFANRKFLDKTSFSQATFCRAPDFHNATLHQDTDFSGAKFMQRKGGDAARAYRTLKLAMELRRARREEGMFHALEQRSLLFSRETTIPEKIVSFLYSVTANYGQAVWRPFVWLIGLQLIIPCLYSNYFSEFAGPSYGQAFHFALQQIFLPFYVFRQTVGSGDPYSLSLLLIAAAQSLATYGLLALFLLALRRRFRMA